MDIKRELKIFMEKISEDFISKEPRIFEWKIGHVLASSLSGFIAGLIVASIVFVTIFDLTLKSSNIGF